MEIKAVAYLLGEGIRIKDFKSSYTDSIQFSSATEVLLKKGESSFIYFQSHGEVAFSNCDDQLISEFLVQIKPYVEFPYLQDSGYKEDFTIRVNPSQELGFEYNLIRIPEINAEVIMIILHNLSQSVTLDHFTALSQEILQETATITKELELRGKLRIGKGSLMKFIGKALCAQNRIIDNLYLFDAPDTVWENEYLALINAGLSRTFKLKKRFREVEYTFKVIDSSLAVFTQLVQHRDSKKMDAIIIFLIAFEILNALIGKLF